MNEHQLKKSEKRLVQHYK